METGKRKSDIVFDEAILDGLSDEQIVDLVAKTVREKHHESTIRSMVKSLMRSAIRSATRSPRT
jgi:hypothetical protein